MSMSRWMTVSIVCVFLLGSLWGSAQADPLDRISGTEHWRGGGNKSDKQEWADWLRARIAWRKAKRMLLLERARNLHLARLRKRGRPSLGDVRRVMRARLRPSQPVRVQTDRRPLAEPDAVLQVGRQKAPQPSPGPSYDVPVERLDKHGQAVDDEGDRILNQPKKRRRR
jgi:hypothetical protein